MMTKHWVGALLLTLSVTGGSQFIARTAQAAVADDVRQAVSAHAGDIDGAALSAELASIIANSGNPATAAAEAVAALGDNASPITLKAVADAIESTPGISPDDFAAALGLVVADAGTGAEGISANVIGVAKYFNASNRRTAGKGIAIAVNRLQGNPETVDTASRIVAQVEASDIGELKDAYAEAMDELETSGLTAGGDNLLQQAQNTTSERSPN